MSAFADDDDQWAALVQEQRERGDRLQAAKDTAERERDQWRDDFVTSNDALANCHKAMRDALNELPGMSDAAVELSNAMNRPLPDSAAKLRAVVDAATALAPALAKEPGMDMEIRDLVAAFCASVAALQASRTGEDDNAKYKCVRGHDKCSEMYPGPECPYCEKVQP